MKKILGILSICLFISLNGFSQHWDSLEGGINRFPTRLRYDSISNKLYVGGSFKKADHKWINGIGSWDGSQWDSLGHGIDFFDTIPSDIPGNTWAITRFGNYLYVGGGYRMAGNILTNGLARWDGTNWDTVPGARFVPYTNVEDIVVNNNELYICGTFDSVGNVPASRIAKWNGTTWQAIGNNHQFTTPSGDISFMRFYHGNLYVAGVFYDPLGNICRLAKWDGSNWQFITNQVVGGLAGVNHLEVFNDELYVAGLFYDTDGNAGTSIIRWNDTIWRDVGGSVQIVNSVYPQVTDMCVHNGKLFCVGNFEKIGGVIANSLASWDGTQWCGYGTYFDNKVGSIAFLNDTMYLGGGFLHEDNDSIRYIIKWIGGGYVDSCGVINTGINHYDDPISMVSVYPNPATTSTTFKMEGLNGNKTLIIYDQLGKEIWRKETNENQIELSVENFSVGFYFYQVSFENGNVVSGKFIVQ